MENWDQVEGKLKDVAGDVTGDASLEREGEAQGVFGDAREAVGDLGDRVGDLKDEAEERFGGATGRDDSSTPS